MRKLPLVLLAGILTCGAIAMYLADTALPEYDYFSKPNPQYSLEGLAEWGYYAYVLPEEQENLLGLRRSVRLATADGHCNQSFSNVYIDPVYVTYYSDGQTIYLITRVSTGRVLLDSFEDYRFEIPLPIALDYPWIPDQEGRYNFTEDGLTQIRFKDHLGMDIRVEAPIEPEALADLIGMLEYVGPDVDSVGNPWANACKS